MKYAVRAAPALSVQSMGHAVECLLVHVLVKAIEGVQVSCMDDESCCALFSAGGMETKAEVACRQHPCKRL